MIFKHDLGHVLRDFMDHDPLNIRQFMKSLIHVLRGNFPRFGQGKINQVKIIVWVSRKMIFGILEWRIVCVIPVFIW